MFVLIGAGTVNCEVRKASTISGQTVTLNGAVWRAHSNGEYVVFTDNENLSMAYWGAKGDNVTDDTNAIQAALDQSGIVGCWVSGLDEFHAHKITHPLVATTGCRFRRFKGVCSGFSGVAEAAGAAFMGANHGVVEFTAAASTDTFTVTRWALTGGGTAASANDVIVFTDPLGQGLPAPLVAGKVYYVKTWSGTGLGATFTISATSGGATLDITSDGAGRAYQKVNGAGRYYLYDVYLDGQNIAGLNGYRMAVQQPIEVHKLRGDNFPGVGLIVGYSAAGQETQQGEFYNCEFLSCGTGIQTFGLGGSFYYPDCEVCTVGISAEASGWRFYSFHGESNTQDIVIGTSGSSNEYRQITFIAPWLGASGVDAAHTPITVQGTSSHGFMLLNAWFASANTTGRLLINDTTSRSKQLLFDDLNSTQANLGYLWQPEGLKNWVFLDGVPVFRPKVRTFVTFTSIAAGATQDQTVTVTGANVGDRVVVAPEATIASLMWMGHVNTTNTVTIRVYNPTAGAITPPAVNWDVNVLS